MSSPKEITARAGFAVLRILDTKDTEEYKGGLVLNTSKVLPVLEYEVYDPGDVVDLKEGQHVLASKINRHDWVLKSGMQVCLVYKDEIYAVLR